MDFENLNLPEITPVILILWAVCIFVVGYFYWHAPKKSRVRLVTILSVISTLFFFIWLYFWYQSRPPFTPVRIAVFPFVEQTNESDPITWRSIALSEISTNYLNAINSEKLLAYQIDWIYTVANRDSLTLPIYVLDFSKRIKLDYAVLGRIVKKSPELEVDFQLYRLVNKELLLNQTMTMKSGEFDELSKRLTDVILGKVLGSEYRGNIGNSINSDTQLTNYFTARFSHLTEKGEPAVRFAELAVKEDSVSVICLNFLAELYLKRGFEKKNQGESPLDDFRSVKLILLKALSLEENQSTSLRLLAELYLLNKKWNQAETYLRRALKANPLDPQIYFDLIQLHPSRYKSLGYKNEKQLLKRAIYINPCYLKARLTLAKYYFRKNRQDLAIKAVKDLLRINPHSVEGLMELGRYYIAQKDVLNLLPTFEKVIQLDPNNADAYYNLGIVYYHSKDYDTAIRFFERAIQLGNHLDSHLYLAYIYELRGEMETAIEHLRIRIKQRTSQDDKFAEEARKHLFQIMSQSGVIDSVMSRQ
jgi:tetratricopeptide (TPR) repeat protein